MPSITQPEYPCHAEYPTEGGPHAVAIETAYTLFVDNLALTEGWEDQGTKEGVRLFKRPDPKDTDGTPIVKGEGLVKNCTFLAVLQIPGFRKRWDDRLKTGLMMARFSRTFYQFYVELKGLAFIIDKRYVNAVARLSLPTEERKETYIIQTSVDDALVPDQAGKVRATIYFTGWELKQQGDDLKTTFIAQLALNGSIPKMLANKAAVETALCCAQARDCFYNVGFAPYVAIDKSAGQSEEGIIFQFESFSDPNPAGELTYELCLTSTNTEPVEFDILYDKKRMYKEAMAATERTPLLSKACVTADSYLSTLPVYQTIYLVFREIESNIDVPLSDEQLRSPEIAFAVIKPLEELLGELNDPSIVYVLLLNRLHFLREAETALASFSLNETRAQLCELLAIRLLRHQATQAKGPNAGLLAMSRALVGGFHAFQGAGQDVLDRVKQKEGITSRIMNEGAGKTNALELAILGKARGFIKSHVTQKVITAIWDGKIVYSSSSFLDILPDRWKIHEIRVYNLKDAPILDHYRLRVPKYRAIIDFWSFVVLFGSFLAVIVDRQQRQENLPVAALTNHEKWFFLYALGYSLDRIASVMEHGWQVYSASLNGGLDALCVPIFAIAFGFRIHSIAFNDQGASDQAFAVLSCAACLLFPRLAFAAVSNNVLILSLRAMLANFFWLMGLAVFCFLGFVFALNHLCDGAYSVSRISEWFGLDGTGIDKSVKFHPTLGPTLFIAYAALSNTLLVSLLVAILSSTYARIAEDEAAEDMFRRAVMTFEGVKSDSLFDYVPPLNLVALCIMWPISHFSSPRWFHKINVAVTRIFSLPILLLIALYERQAAAGAPIYTWLSDARVHLTKRLPTRWAQKLSLLEGAHWECEAVFEYSPSGDEKSDDDEEPFSEDEVEDVLEGGRNRISSRASRVISGPTPGLPAPPTFVQSTPVTRAPSPVSIPDPRPKPTRPPKGSPPTRTKTHFASSHERLPSNASISTYGIPISRRTKSPEREDVDRIRPSSSAPAKHPSPLAELYQHRDEGPGVGVGTGLRRRMSMAASRSEIATEPGQRELRDMVNALAETLARLESRLGESEAKANSEAE
ncbi:nonselective cation channel [Pseudohyphozyma bogoriensis]|nr:nonselective cation channel [Pseudohyphozyma bogoriensis]